MGNSASREEGTEAEEEQETTTTTAPSASSFLQDIDNVLDDYLLFSHSFSPSSEAAGASASSPRRVQRQQRQQQQPSSSSPTRRRQVIILQDDRSCSSPASVLLCYRREDDGDGNDAGRMDHLDRSSSTHHHHYHEYTSNGEEEDEEDYNEENDDDNDDDDDHRDDEQHSDHADHYYDDWRLAEGTSYHLEDDVPRVEHEQDIDNIMLEYVMKRKTQLNNNTRKKAAASSPSAAVSKQQQQQHPQQHPQQQTSISSILLLDDVDCIVQPSAATLLEYAQCSMNACSVPDSSGNHIGHSNNNSSSRPSSSSSKSDHRPPHFVASCGVVAGSIVHAIDENMDRLLDHHHGSSNIQNPATTTTTTKARIIKSANKDDDDPAEYGSQSRPILVAEDHENIGIVHDARQHRSYSSSSPLLPSSLQQEPEVNAVAATTTPMVATATGMAKNNAKQDDSISVTSNDPLATGVVVVDIAKEKPIVSALPSPMVTMIPPDVFPASASESFHLFRSNNNNNDIIRRSSSGPDCCGDSATPIIVPTHMHHNDAARPTPEVLRNHPPRDSTSIPSWCVAPTPVIANHHAAAAASPLSPPSWCKSPTNHVIANKNHHDFDVASTSSASSTSSSSSSSLEQDTTLYPPPPPPPPPPPMMTSHSIHCPSAGTSSGRSHGPPPAPDVVFLHRNNNNSNWSSRNIKKFNKQVNKQHRRQRAPPTPDDPFMLLFNHGNTNVISNRRRRSRSRSRSRSRRRPDVDYSKQHQKQSPPRAPSPLANQVKMVTLLAPASSSSTAAAAAAFEKILSAVSEKSSSLPLLLPAASTASTTTATACSVTTAAAEGEEEEGPSRGRSTILRKSDPYTRTDVPSSGATVDSIMTMKTTTTTSTAPRDSHCWQVDNSTAPKMTSNNAILGKSVDYFSGQHEQQQHPPVVVGLVMHQHHHHLHHINNENHAIRLASTSATVHTTTSTPPLATNEQQDQQQHSSLDGGGGVCNYDRDLKQQCKLENAPHPNKHCNNHNAMEQHNLRTPRKGKQDKNSTQWQNSGNNLIEAPHNDSKESENRMFSFAHVESEDDGEEEVIVIEEANLGHHNDQPAVVESRSDRSDHGDPQGIYVPSVNERQTLNYSVHRPQQQPSSLPLVNYSKAKDRHEQENQLPQATDKREDEPELNPNRRDSRSTASGRTIQVSNLADQQPITTASVEEDEIDAENDIDMSFVDQYESFFNAFLWQSADLLVRNPDFIATLRVAKLQKLLQVNMDREAALERELEHLKRSKQEMVQSYQAKLIEASRFKAAREIQLQQQLTTIEQATLVTEGRLTWEIITRCDERAKQQQQLIKEFLQQQQAVDPGIGQEGQRQFFMSILPDVPETQLVRDAMTAPSPGGKAASRPLAQKQQQQQDCDLRQLQVDNALLKSEVQVLEKQLAYKKVAAKKHSWVDSVFLRMDDKRMQRLKGRYQKKLGVTF